MASNSSSGNANPRTLSAKRRSNSSPELQIHGMDTYSPEIQDASVLKSLDAKNNESGPSTSSADRTNGAVPQICLEHLRALPRSDGYIGPDLNTKDENKRSDTQSSPPDIVEKENESPKTEHVKVQKRRQSGLSRVASVIVAKFYPKDRSKKPERQDSKETDSGSSSDSDSPALQRGRSKSLSGRILRRFRDASRERNSDETNATPKRRQSHRDTSKSGERTRNQTRKKRYTPLINFAEFDPQLYPTECEEDIQRAIREKEIQEGVDPPPGFQSQYSDSDETTISATSLDTCCHCPPPNKPRPKSPQALIEVPDIDPSIAPYPKLSKVVPDEMKDELQPSPPAAAAQPEATYMTPQAHTQVDYMHCLVPDQQTIMNSCFYWGKIDRYEADEILENKPEGTFLLRDSSQEEFLFSVSFRRYGRTLHARIEQWNHTFSFDAHDPSVFSWHTICGLLEHYKDPNYCMFFEPMLTIPLPRTNPPTLQELARSVICSQTTYDGIHYLELPRVLKDYLKEYHYKQRVRVRQINNHPEAAAKAPSPKFVYKNVSNTCISR